MEREEAKRRVSVLRTTLKQYNHQYYDLDDPTVSDYEYDMLLKELGELENQYPELITEDSPTRRVGGVSSSTFEKVTHEIQMGSLQDVFSFEELRDFDRRIRESITPCYVVEPKIDGLSVSLEYTNGVLTRGSTRGDGFVGEDVTENLKTIRDIPQRLSSKIPFLEVRGEVYMPRKSFEELVKEQLKKGETPFKNPRNAAAGSLRQKNNQITLKRKLGIFVFNLQRVEGKEFKDHDETLDFLKSEGFSVSPSYRSFTDIEPAIGEIKRIGEERYQFTFDIDGAVIKVNDLSQRKFLGSTAKYPKWAVAFKYPPEEKKTTLLAIQINVGRTGALTPTAVFEPISLAGTTVSRAVLHNQDFIDEKDIRIGDTIVVRKAGEIIPEVVCSLVHAPGSVPYQIPDICPSCGEKVVREADQAVLRCVNPNCPSAVYRNIIHFVSRDAMDIEGLGPALVQSMIDAGFLKTSADLYSLTQEEVVSLDGMGKKSVENLFAALQRSKQRPLSRLIYGLGIRNIGQKAAELLCKKFLTLDQLLKASYEDFMQIDGFGDIMAQSLLAYFKKPESQELLEQFRKSGLNLTEPKTKVGDRLSGLTFVITGTLPNMSRNEVKALIQKNGGTVSSSVSKKTDYLLAGEDGGSKLQKAEQLDVKVISLQSLNALLG